MLKGSAGGEILVPIKLYLWAVLTKNAVSSPDSYIISQSRKVLQFLGFDLGKHLQMWLRLKHMLKIFPRVSFHLTFLYPQTRHVVFSYLPKPE